MHDMVRMQLQINNDKNGSVRICRYCCKIDSRGWVDNTWVASEMVRSPTRMDSQIRYSRHSSDWD